MSRTIERKDTPPFLDVDPPHWAAKGLSYILILLFTVAVLLALFVRIPETVSSPFTLLPVQGTDPIRALYDGTILEVRAQEGQMVKKGDPIYTLRSDSLVDRASEYRSLETRNKGAMESLNNARRKHESQQRTDEQEIVGLRNRNEFLTRMIKLKTDELNLTKEKVERYKKLYDTGISSPTDYSDQQLQVSKIGVELEGLQREVSDNQLDIRKLQNEMATRRVEFEESTLSWEQEIERTQNRMDMLKGSLDQHASQNFNVPASCNGTLLRLRVTAPGAVVQEGDVLCDVVCAEATLQAELSVPQSGVGRIRPGQTVKLLYDSFPFQRYGVKSGAVRWVSPAGDKTVFRVLVDIADHTVMVQGHERELMPGMGGMAEIVIGRRSVISYAFEPIRQLRENLKS
jgi:multidrug efflux pump subunit AcrA (membrane-fusion protein)